MRPLRSGRPVLVLGSEEGRDRRRRALTRLACPLLISTSQLHVLCRGLVRLLPLGALTSRRESHRTELTGRRNASLLPSKGLHSGWSHRVCFISHQNLPPHLALQHIGECGGEPNGLPTPMGGRLLARRRARSDRHLLRRPGILHIHPTIVALGRSREWQLQIRRASRARALMLSRLGCR